MKVETRPRKGGVCSKKMGARPKKVETCPKKIRGCPKKIRGCPKKIRACANRPRSVLDRPKWVPTCSNLSEPVRTCPNLSETDSHYIPHYAHAIARSGFCNSPSRHGSLPPTDHLRPASTNRFSPRSRFRISYRKTRMQTGSSTHFSHRGRIVM